MKTDLSNEELAAELEEFAPRAPRAGSPREERIIAGFEEIQRFVDEHGRTPQHGEDRDIFERLYAVRLDQIRRLKECRELLGPLDHQELLAGDRPLAPDPDALDDDALLEELGVDEDAGPDITNLKHVRPRSTVRVPDEIASRTPCRDFAEFEPVFEKARRELASGVREARPFANEASIEKDFFFILGGQMVYVAEVGEKTTAPNGQTNARLLVIYDNGTESNLLLRSLERALHKDETSRRLTDPNAGPLFGDQMDEGDTQTGTIYVLRSHSDNPYVTENRELIHKIGVTGGKIEARIADAENQATFLLAKVEVVASYRLAGINRVKLENLLHRIFAPAQLDLEIQDRFGKPVKPREWFLVPLHIIDDAITRIREGRVDGLIYDPGSASLVAEDG